MDIAVNQKQISQEERDQIGKQVRSELIEHLYQGCLPGTVSGLAATTAVFLDFYGYSPIKPLVSWYISINLMLVLLTGLYFFYVKNKNKINIAVWEHSYSLVMCGCALSWVPIVLLMPYDVMRQFSALVALFLITTGYATGTIGQFRLCVTTLSIMLLPLIAWCFGKGGIFYSLIGTYITIYIIFMFGANHRSTKWFKDSLKLKLENTLVSYQANHDILTDLPNQRLLPQFIESAIDTVKNTEDTFALVCFSLNRMEIINDSLGHQAGNAIMQTVATRLKEATDYIISISRSDTFNIIIAPIKLDEAEEKIRILFSVLDEPIFLETQEIKITASVGVSFFKKDGNDTATLLSNADAAMLRAKQYGGNHLEFYTAEINAQMPKQLELENDLHSALKNNQLQLYYQPLIDLKTRQISGMEALLRWIHPVHGFIPPMSFIPIAEETGLIIPIGEWIIEEACRQTKRWHEMGYMIRVAVNVSGKQLHQKNLIGIIENILQKTNFDRQYLELELTETAILEESVIHVIKEFKNIGLRLAVDDFGTGYSGLSYLKRFAIDKLKIDQSFIRDIPASNDSITIVSAIIAMAKELKVSTLAEGVETEEQLDFLIGKGCDYIQGYYFSKPLETNAFTQFLVNWRERTAQKAME